MCMEGGFASKLDSLHPFMQEMGLTLNDARDALVRAYHYLEKDIDNRMFSIKPETYEEMGSKYSYIADTMKEENVRTERIQGW